MVNFALNRDMFGKKKGRPHRQKDATNHAKPLGKIYSIGCKITLFERPRSFSA